MYVEDYLVEHAIKNVWSEPYQDFQLRVKPHRITSWSGAIKYVDILFDRYSLPTQTDWYHVFTIGEFHPNNFRLLECFNVWYSFGHLINELNLVAEAFTTGGVILPRLDTYMMFTPEGTTVIAVRDEPKVANLRTEDISVRFYTNAYFDVSRGVGEDGTSVIGTIARDVNHIQEFHAEINLLKGRRGHVFQYVNGRLVTDISTFTAEPGDVLEAHWDSTVVETRRWDVKDLTTFLSDLDGELKYILNNRGDIGDTIRYRDDVEIYVVKMVNDQIYTGGRYYHKLIDSSIRMLTHTDYSIHSGYVTDLAVAEPTWGEVGNLTILMYIREAGFNRPLVGEINRIKDLYRLNSDQRLQAMQGTFSGIPEWRAAHLESSMYTKVMQMDRRDITPYDVLCAYGYHAASSLVAPGMLPVGNSNFITVPPGLVSGGTIFEYDADGYLIGNYRHENGHHYVLRNGQTKFVEGIIGTGSTKLTTVYHKATTVLDPRVNYAFYKRPIVSTTPAGEWVVATPDVDYVVSPDGKTVSWLLDMSDWYTAVKNDATFLVREHRFPYQDGVLKFTINVDETRTDGQLYTSAAEIPFGQIDIWLNRKALIQDLDYFVEWPEVCIVNKEYVIDGEWQYITIRGSGFCNENMEPEVPVEYGFVEHGKLSSNNHFNIRDEIVLKVCVEGATYSKLDLRYIEDDGGVTIAGVRNGAPYQIQESFVPLLLDDGRHDQFELRASARDFSDRVGDFLTTLLPQPEEEHPNPIPRIYSIYSPYSSKVLHDIVNGITQDEDIPENMSDQDILEYSKKYDYLLKWDPLFRSINRTYVDIEPHNRKVEFNLSVKQWRFYSRLIRLRLGDTLSTSKFITIG